MPEVIAESLAFEAVEEVLEMKAAKVLAVVTASLCFSIAIWMPLSTHAQTQPAAYQAGAGKADTPGQKVPFERAPIGPDGKAMLAVPPRPSGEQPYGMTDEAIRVKALVEKGLMEAPAKPLPQGFKAAGESAAAAGPIARNSFPGIAGSVTPPDVGMAAGPFQILTTVNNSFTVFDKNGTAIGGQSLSSLFAPVGPAANDFMSDPSTVYDPFISRFWMIVLTQNDSLQRATLLIALSNSNDLNAGFTVFATDATLDGSTSTTHWCDYPHIGFDPNEIYITCNMFNFPAFPAPGMSKGSFQYAKIRVMAKSEFVNNTCCSWWDFFNMHEGLFNAFPAFTIQPAVEHGAAALGVGEFLVDSQGGGAAGNTLTVWQILNGTNCCNGILPSPVLNEAGQGVSSYLSPRGGEQPLNPDGSTPPDIDTGDARLLSADWAGGHLSTTQNSDCSTGFLAFNACAAFYEIDVSAYPTMSVVNDWALQANSVDFYYPAVDANFNSDKAMVFSRSSRSEFVGEDFVTIPNSGSCTNCTGAQTTLAPGLAVYNNGGTPNRWGDYYTAAADPDGLGIWIDGQFATATTTWGTQVGSLFNSYVPTVSASSNPLSFGNVTVFTTGFATEVITNTGNSTLDLGFVSLSGDIDFSVVSDSCSFTSVEMGQSCSVGIQFLPLSVGLGNTTLTIPSNAPTVSVSISATAVQAHTTTSLTSSPNPSVFGQPVTYQATVASSTLGTPTGSATFRDCFFAGPFCAFFPIGTVGLTGDVGALTVSFLAVGRHLDGAGYSGDANFTSSSSNFVTQIVNKDASTVLLTSSRNPSLVGAAVTFTATVHAAPPGSGTPSGTVTFQDGATTLGTRTLASGTVTFVTSTLALGNHSITVVYSGDGNFLGGTSGTLTQMVRDASSTALSSSPNPSVFGQTVNFTATVTPAAATGTVTFKDGAAILGSGAISAGKATLSASALAVKAHSITATYNGSVTYIPSTSPALTQIVNKAASTTGLSSSANPSVSGQSVTFTVTVSAVAPGSGVPTGVVTLKNGTTTLGSRYLSIGKAVFSVSALAVGSSSITAVYNGGTDYSPSTSAVVTQTVNKAATTTTLTGSPNPSALNQTVTFNVTVTAVAPGTGTPSGTVTLKDGTTTLGSGMLSSGKISFSTSLLSHGVHSITAVYGGGANDTGSTSAVWKQTVN